MSRPELGTCHDCADPAVRTLAARAYCERCAETILAPIRARVIDQPGVGIGKQITPRPDWGPGWANLECDECAAGWTGPIGEACGYCARRIEQTRQHQRDILLDPPDDTARHPAWLERLERAKTAGVITASEAHRAIDHYWDSQERTS